MPGLTPTPEPFLIKMVSEGDSFLDSPFVGVIGALVGVAVGASLTFLFSWLQDSRTAKRELSRRYLDEIKTSSARIAQASSDIIYYLNEWESLLRQDFLSKRRNSTQYRLAQLPDLIQELYDTMRQSWFEYQMIAPQKLRDLASKVERAANSATQADDEIKKVRAARIALQDHSRHFQAAVRELMGVPESKESAPKDAFSR